MKTPIRVLRIVTRLNIGGPALHVGVLTHRLDPTRFETLLVTGQPGAREGDLTARVMGDRASMARLRWLQRALHPLKDLVVWCQLFRLMRRYRPHIVHTHMAKAGALGRSAAWVVGRLVGAAQRPVIIHTFHGHVFSGYFSRWQTRVFTWVERCLARVTDRVIAVSASVSSDLLARRIAPAERITIIPLGLSLGPLLELQPRPQHPAVTIAWVGRLVPIKRPELFVQSIAALRHQMPHVAIQALMVGDGPLRGTVEQRVAQQLLQDTVHCVGWVDNMPALYARTDVVCLTSRNEGTPVALIEAMAAGRPVVATTVGGVPNVLGFAGDVVDRIAPGQYIRGQGGLLTRPGDVDGLVAALLTCATHPELRQTLGEEGRAQVRDRYAAARLVQEIEQLYTECLTSTTRVQHRTVMSYAHCHSTH